MGEYESALSAALPPTVRARLRRAGRSVRGEPSRILDSVETFKRQDANFVVDDGIIPVSNRLRKNILEFNPRSVLEKQFINTENIMMGFYM